MHPESRRVTESGFLNSRMYNLVLNQECELQKKMDNISMLGFVGTFTTGQLAYSTHQFKLAWSVPRTSI